MIKNRKNENLIVTIDENENPSGLAFVMHGLGGFKEQPQIRTIVELLKEKKYAVVSFDTTNSFGKSDGNYSDATITNYYEDLEDVISWAKENSWYQEPFLLSGHSVGGLAVSLFAEKYPEMVMALAPLSTIVSGELWKQTQDKAMLEDWKQNGVWIREKKDLSHGDKKILKWGFAEDIMQYDLLKDAKKLTMSVLMIVGENDPTALVSHQKVFFDSIPGRKELHVINGASHVFREQADLAKVSDIFIRWLENIY